MYDNTGTTVESVRGSYPIALSLSPSGTFSSAYASANTISGERTFSSIRILSAGTFTLTASSAGITDGVFASPLQISNYPFSMSIVQNVTTTSVNFMFQLDISLSTEDLLLSASACLVTLTESSGCLNGDTSLSVTGSRSFKVYCSSDGSKTITATCPASGSYPAVTSSVTITLQTLTLAITNFVPVLLT